MKKKREFVHGDEPIKDVPLLYKGCGLDDIHLVNGYVVEETDYGRAVTIKNLDELHHAIGLNIVMYRKVLSPKELRFLRKHLDLTQAELAGLIGQSDQQVARWEKGESEISGPADRLVRVIYLGKCKNIDELSSFVERLSTLHELDDSPRQGLTLRSTKDGWERTAA